MHFQDIFEITFKTPSTGPINVVGPNQFASGHSQNSPEPKGRISPPFDLKSHFRMWLIGLIQMIIYLALPIGIQTLQLTKILDVTITHPS